MPATLDECEALAVQLRQRQYNAFFLVEFTVVLNAFLGEMVIAVRAIHDNLNDLGVHPLIDLPAEWYVDESLWLTAENAGAELGEIRKR